MVHHLPVDIAQSTGTCTDRWAPRGSQAGMLGAGGERRMRRSSSVPWDRAWRTKAKVKARLIGDADPGRVGSALRSTKWMRLSTSRALGGSKYDEAEDILEEQCALRRRPADEQEAVAKRLPLRIE